MRNEGGRNSHAASRGKVKQVEFPAPTGGTLCFQKELPAILGRFLKERGVPIARWYQALRYPEGGNVQAEIEAHEHLQFPASTGAVLLATWRKIFMRFGF